MFKHIYSSISQRPARTIVSSLAVSLGVVLILVSVGLSYGQLNDTAERTRRIGGDFMIQSPDASLFMALNSGTLPVGLVRVIEEIEGIEAATPILVKFISERFHVVFGIEEKSFREVNESLTMVDGRFFDAPDEVIVDTIYANANNLWVGDTLELLGQVFRISGVFQEGTAARVLMSLPMLQEMNGTPEKATMFFAKVREGADVDTVFERLKERMQHYKISKTADLEEMMTSTTPVFKQFLTAMVFISVSISFLIILLAMYSTITERTREIGILKSLGASKRYIIQLILKESLVICSLGAVLGFILTWVAIQLILIAFPSMPVDVPLVWRFAALLMAVGGGALGALYPAFKAAQLDPVKALGYE